jgi:Holliday junction resolvase RusA-like endonuclease
MEITFTVFGTPMPQGSMRAFIPKGWHRPVLTSDNKKLKPYRQQVAETAIAEMAKAGLSCLDREIPVRLDVAFFFAKPKSASKHVTQKTTKPDADKLLRAVFDSITGVIITDDAQIVAGWWSKGFGIPERVEISVSSLDGRWQPDVRTI